MFRDVELSLNIVEHRNLDTFVDNWISTSEHAQPIWSGWPHIKYQSYRHVLSPFGENLISPSFIIRGGGMCRKPIQLLSQDSWIDRVGDEGFRDS